MRRLVIGSSAAKRQTPRLSERAERESRIKMKSFIKFYFDFFGSCFGIGNPINFNCKTQKTEENARRFSV